MKEEDKIMKKYGKGNPFSVPEGYFDNLHEEIMSNLPEKETPMIGKTITTWDKVRPWLYMAAMFIAILLPIRFMINFTNPKETMLTSNNIIENELYIDEYIDAIMTHSMMDDYALYEYLTEEADTDYLYN